jgi:two-component system, chemotaxis family, chemotaxis protein CheY
METKIKVLIVDDVTSARKILSRLLKRLGFNDIIEADSGEVALNLTKENSLGLIISDLHLKDMTGIDFLAQLKSDQTNKIPFLMITSDMSREEFEKARLAGVSEYLLKPFSSESLSAKLKTVLGD